jgi:hypothetical protein
MGIPLTLAEKVSRLEIWAFYLEEQPRVWRHWDMECYGEGRKGVYSDDLPPAVTDCGTAACALGHAPDALPGLFGREWHQDSDGDWYVRIYALDDTKCEDGISNIYAMTKVFGLSLGQVEDIVLPSHYAVEPAEITPFMAAARIREMISKLIAEAELSQTRG